MTQLTLNLLIFFYKKYMTENNIVMIIIIIIIITALLRAILLRSCTTMTWVRGDPCFIVQNSKRGNETTGKAS
jgi:hypothetical protein